MSYDLNRLHENDEVPFLASLGDRFDGLLANAREYNLRPLYFVVPSEVHIELSGRANAWDEEDEGGCLILASPLIHAGIVICSGVTNEVILFCEGGDFRFEMAEFRSEFGRVRGEG